MAVNGINSAVTSTYQTKVDTDVKQAENVASTVAAESTKEADQAVTYEKSEAVDSTKATYNNKKMTPEERTAVIDQLKADQAEREKQMADLVAKTFNQQSESFQIAYQNDPDSIWNEIRQGNFKADAQTIAQAKEDVSEDGYWGVKQTSERILDFAKALSGGDSSKIDTLTDAIKKGFKDAEKLWGGELPEISGKTYDAIMQGIEDWKKEATSGDVKA
ncbi:MAG: hypothetical protein IKQ71_10920 [Lachnospiraceae bacterium]|nr:hypothetical protein [Lachnospiraceae bacterium]